MDFPSNKPLHITDTILMSWIVCILRYADHYYYVRGTVGAIYSVYDNQPVVQLTEESSNPIFRK